MNHPHGQRSDLLHPDNERLPDQIKHFAAAINFRSEFWRDEDKLRSFFNVQGHKQYYVENIIQYVRSRFDFYHLWQRQVIGTITVVRNEQNVDMTNLDPNQSRVLAIAKDFLRERTEAYDDIPEANLGVLDDDLSDETEDVDEYEQNLASATGIDWKKFLLVQGKPGTGKSFAVKAVIQHGIDQEYNVCCATPTGILTSTHRNQFVDDNFACDTIHSLFRYPVNENERPQINWDLGRYDLVVIDELSMVPTKVFSHIYNTFNQLHVRPVVVLCGDKQQQQPIETVEGKTQQTTGILNDANFYRNCIVVNFLEEHRCRDPLLQEYLNYLRYYKPSREFLKELFRRRTLCNSNVPSNQELADVLITHSEALVLTVSRNAVQQVNSIAIDFLFSGQIALAIIQYDNELEMSPVYRGMKLIVTRNRKKKKNGVVNGQTAIALTFHNKTLFLKLPDGNVVAIYLMTEITEQGE